MTNKTRLAVLVEIEGEEGSSVVRRSIKFTDEERPHSSGEAPSRETAFALVATVFADMAESRRLRRKR